MSPCERQNTFICTSETCLHHGMGPCTTWTLFSVHHRCSNAVPGHANKYSSPCKKTNSWGLWDSPGFSWIRCAIWEVERLMARNGRLPKRTRDRRAQATADQGFYDLLPKDIVLRTSDGECQFQAARIDGCGADDQRKLQAE